MLYDIFIHLEVDFANAINLGGFKDKFRHELMGVAHVMFVTLCIV